MSAYLRAHRIAPLWAMCVLSVPILAGTYSIVREGFWECVAGGPLFLTFGYALAVGFVTRVQVQADWRGVRISYGPLPVAPKPEDVPHSDVVKVYVRHATMPTRTGSIPYLAAGVQRRDGRWVDLSQPLLDDATVWKEAAEIARALAWPRPVEELRGRAPRSDWNAARAVWYWGGAVTAGFLWGCVTEMWLRQ